MKKMTSIIASVIIFGAMSNFAFADFSDVPQDHDNLTSILWMSDNGVIEGYVDGTFRPDQPVNRVEFLKMLYTTLEVDTGLTTTTAWDDSFPDVDEAQWYWTYLRHALEEGTVAGYPDGFFRPEDTINYAEAAKIVGNAYFGVDNWFDEDAEHAFSTCELNESRFRSDWFWRYLAYLDEACIFPDELSEISSNNRPAMDVTRGQMAEMLYRAKAVQDNNDDYEDLRFVSLDTAPLDLNFEPGTQPPVEQSPIVADRDVPDNERIFVEEDRGIVFDHPEEWQIDDTGDIIFFQHKESDGVYTGPGDITVALRFFTSGATLLDWFDATKRIAEDQILFDIERINQEVTEENAWTRDDVDVIVTEGTTSSGYDYIRQQRVNYKPGLEGGPLTSDCYYVKDGSDIFELCATVETNASSDELLDLLDDLVDGVEFL